MNLIIDFEGYRLQITKWIIVFYLYNQIKKYRSKLKECVTQLILPSYHVKMAGESVQLFQIASLGLSISITIGKTSGL